MNTYLVIRTIDDGSEEEVVFRCDYDLGQALNTIGLSFLIGLIGIKSARGPVKWHRGGIEAATITMWREEAEYVGGGN